MKLLVVGLTGDEAYADARGVSWPIMTGVLAPLRGGVWNEKTRFRVGVRGMGVFWLAEEPAPLAEEELRIGEDGRETDMLSSSANSFESMVENVAFACSVFQFLISIFCNQARLGTNLEQRPIHEE